MTSTELIQAIKAEIEKLKGFYNPDDFYDQAYLESLADVESFLSTLESEKPMNLEEEINRTYHDGSVADTSDLDHNSYENIARHFAEWGAEHAKIESEKPVPNDLEEAADEMAISAFPEKKSYSTVYDRVVDYNAVDRKNYRDGIIAGSKWQKEHDAELIEIAYNDGITIGMTKQKEQMMDEWLKDRDGCFWDGVNEGKKAMKEQMMKDTVEGEITKDNRGNNVLRSGVFNNGFEIGDKVRIIIIKDNGQSD